MMIDQALDLAINLAKKAGNYQKTSLGKKLSIEYKGEINLVTEVDKACEEMIIGGIIEKFPSHDILAEEGGGHRRDSDYKWIIDPLDGTTNFAHGYPLFCVSIALEYKQEVILGVVYEPNLDELFIATKGGGAFLNGSKIEVSQQNRVDRSLIATGFAYNIRETGRNNIKEFSHILLNAQAVRRDGVAAVDLCYVACGRYDGFWELNLFPWDVSAGSLILTEAKGEVSNYRGDNFSVYEKEILATNGFIHQEMIRLLNY